MQHRAVLQRLPSRTLQQQYGRSLGRQCGNAYLQRVLAPARGRPAVRRDVADDTAAQPGARVVDGSAATPHRGDAAWDAPSATAASVQRQPVVAPAAAGAAATTAPAPAAAAPAAAGGDPAAAIADDYEADAIQYFTDNMDVELRTAAAVEGAAIGRSAARTAAGKVRETCEPYERDQEFDTNVMNTIFAVGSGGATVGEGATSGPRRGADEVTGDNAANVGSRIVRAGLGVVQVWLPTLAGYRTVGQLKDAAVRQLGEGAEQAGGTTSAEFGAYEDAVMHALLDDWEREAASVKEQIRTHTDPRGAAMIARGLLPVQRLKSLTKLRKDYGSASQHAGKMTSAITKSLAPMLASLRQHLEAAKISRQRWQAAGAFGGGVALGAAAGAGLTAWLGPGAAVGAGVGAVVGGVIGGIGALSILFS